MLLGRLSSSAMLVIAFFVGIAASLPIDNIDDQVGTCILLGNFVVVNNCTSTIFVQSVAGSEIDPVHTVKQNAYYYENFDRGVYEGVAIKMTKNATDWTTPMLLEYSANLDMDQVFYDISVSVGTGEIGTNFILTPALYNPNTNISSCVDIVVGDSYVHLGEQDYETKSCPLATNLVIGLCSDH